MTALLGATMTTPWRCGLRLHASSACAAPDGQWYRECRSCGKQRINIYKEGPRPSSL
jgi:hypothetical protein